MTFFHWSRLCRAPNSEKVIMALSLELSGILWWNFAYTLILTYPWDCQMTFEIGWVFAEVQILEKVRLLQNEIYHRLRLCRVPNSEKVKMALSLELWRILWWNFAYSLKLTSCSQWDCQITFRLGRGSNSEKKKKWKWPYLLNLSIYCDKILQTHYYWHDLNRGIAKSSPRDCKMTFNIGWGCAELQILKKWKWPNWVDYCDETFAFTLILTRCSPRDCQMSFGIGWGIAEVQILKNSEIGPISWNFLNILIKLCINIAIDMS